MLGGGGGVMVFGSGVISEGSSDVVTDVTVLLVPSNVRTRFISDLNGGFVEFPQSSFPGSSRSLGCFFLVLSICIWFKSLVRCAMSRRRSSKFPPVYLINVYRKIKSLYNSKSYWKYTGTTCQ